MNIYAMPAENVYNLLQENINLVNQELKVNKSLIRYWIRKKKALPLKVLSYLHPNVPLLKLIEETNIHCTRGTQIVRVPKINLKIAYLLGLVCTDGHVSKKRKLVEFIQKDREFINGIAEIIQEEFNMWIRKSWMFTESTGVTKLKIDSTPLTFIFSELYNIPVEKKGDFNIPGFIKNGRAELKLAFIAGAFDGDGGITVSDHICFDRPRISIYNASKVFLKDIKLLLESFNIRTAFSKKRRGAFSLLVNRIEDLIKLHYLLFPYLRLKRKIEIFKKLLSQKRILELVRVRNNTASNLLKLARNKLGNQKRLLEYINQYLQTPRKMAALMDWTFGREPIPLIIAVKICDLLEVDYFERIPTHYAAILFYAGIIDMLRLNALRKDL